MDNLWIIYGYGWWLNPTPLKNMSSSIEMMTFPTEWKNVPNHQPGIKRNYQQSIIKNDNISSSKKEFHQLKWDEIWPMNKNLGYPLGN